MTAGFQERRNIDMMVGTHEGRLNAHDTMLNKIDQKLDAMDEKLDTIQATMNQGKGMGSLGKWLIGIAVSLGFFAGKGQAH